MLSFITPWKICDICRHITPFHMYIAAHTTFLSRPRSTSTHEHVHRQGSEELERRVLKPTFFPVALTCSQTRHVSFARLTRTVVGDSSPADPNTHRTHNHVRNNACQGLLKKKAYYVTRVCDSCQDRLTGRRWYCCVPRLFDVVSDSSSYLQA